MFRNLFLFCFALVTFRVVDATNDVDVFDLQSSTIAVAVQMHDLGERKATDLEILYNNLTVSSDNYTFVWQDLQPYTNTSSPDICTNFSGCKGLSIDLEALFPADEYLFNISFQLNQTDIAYRLLLVTIPPDSDNTSISLAIIVSITCVVFVVLLIILMFIYCDKQTGVAARLRL